MLNVRADEAELYKRAHSKTVVLQCGTAIRECLDQLKGGQFVVIEDIISLANKDEESLRQLINYKAHHDKLRIVCVSHMLYKTKMLTLLPLFNFVLITLSPSSRGLLKIACSQGFHLEAEKAEQWMQSFASRCTGQPGSFAYINSARQTLHFLPDDEDDDDDDDDDDDAEPVAKRVREVGNVTARGARRRWAAGEVVSAAPSAAPVDLEKRFAECFAGHERAATARAIFSVISKVLTSRECTAFRPFDLSFAFAQRRASTKLKRVSIVDYVDCLLDAGPTAAADPSHKALHRYLRPRCKLPKMFIRNPHFALPDDGVDSSDESA